MTKENLDKIIENHKLWLEANGTEGKRADLRWADLSGANLSGANLSWADLSGANLSWADLSGANLSEANLSGDDLSEANLSGANLRWADLSGANLSWANLSGDDLSWADLSWANLSGDDLSEANLSGANLDYSCWPLWCGSLKAKIDDKQAVQLLYHLLRVVQCSEEVSDEVKNLLLTDAIVEKANEFHRVDECGKIMAKASKKANRKK